MLQTAANQGETRHGADCGFITVGGESVLTGLGLGLVPEGHELVPRRLLHIDVVLPGARLDGAESTAKLVAGLAKRLFSVDAQRAGVVSDVEQDVAELLARGFGARSGRQLADLLR